MRRRARGRDRVFDKPGAYAVKLALARAMRAMPTAAEAALWQALRDRRLSGWKFRRQHVIGGYVVDFYCPALGLVIEVDGSVHDGRRAQDRQRDQDLTALGVQVLRLRNADVLERLESVAASLTLRCQTLAERLTAVKTSPAPAGEATDPPRLACEVGAVKPAQLISIDTEKGSEQNFRQ
jgi:very-short-patch-repair endonuclease